ncbi:MAG: ABC transporter ATP-binding protein, partial [Deltaproteobacteria bacterium]|nr:ABC transporter ATP-binding protein [Deltaproteobacteria bacterium]
MSGTDTQSSGKKPAICLEIRDVVKQFPGVTAVDHVNLQIRDGEIFSFLGPSGCGKSTLLRVVAGLENQDQGDVLIAGQNVNELPPYKRDCNTVFQTHALFPHMTVAENIGFGLVERRLPKSEIKKKVADKIELVTLGGMEHRRPDQLSGGQQQRVALARALILEPTVLLLDEPLAALDRKLRKEMQIELKRIQREVGTTFLNVTHDQKEALSVSDRIGIMNEGAFLQIGTPDGIYENPGSIFVASFMGATNIFIGRVVSQKGGRIELETPEGLRMFAPEPDARLGDPVTGVSVHPELISLRPEASGEPPADPTEKTEFHGIIREVFYQGDFSEFTVTLKEADMLLTVHLTRGRGYRLQLPEGQEVTISWDYSSNNVLRG